MTEQAAKPKKEIGNVGTLDIRNASPETIAEIDKVGNVGMIIYSPETAPLLARLNIGNMGMSVEAAADAQVITGELEIDSDYLKSQPKPPELLVLGRLIIKPEVTAEEIESGLEKLVVCGLVLCPEPLMGVVRAKLSDFEGKILPYSESMQFVKGKISLDRGYLENLEDGSQLLVMGKIDVPEVLDEDLLTRKIAGIHVMGKISCREENLATLRSLLDGKGGEVKIDAIPSGFEPMDGHLVLDAFALGKLPGNKLYCTGVVQIGDDVASAPLDQALEALQITNLLICPIALRETMAAKCDVIKTKTIFYEGELLLIDDQTELIPSRFDYLEGKATLVVRDLLTISPDVDPKVLADSLHKVHNMEAIRCTPEQMGAIQARMGLNEGRLIDSTKKEENKEEKKDENKIGNVGHLKL
jgi:hypothetical protein